MGPMRETKMTSSGSKDALKEMLARPGSGEPDDAPMPLEQIHKELGKHIPPEMLKEGHDDYVTEPVGGLEVTETKRDDSDGKQHWSEMKRIKP